LKSKGHLGEGADADIAIYDINPKKIDPSNQYVKIMRTFRKAAYTIKDGEILVRDGIVVKSIGGKTLWVDVNLSSPERIDPSLKERFREYWTVEYDNYSIPESYLDHSKSIITKAEV
jgi:formylmethanofuran dehydrogenase subunit A